jgi:hypothetical protein
VNGKEVIVMDDNEDTQHPSTSSLSDPRRYSIATPASHRIGVILAIDVGSSSIRCTAYDGRTPTPNRNINHNNNDDDDDDDDDDSQSTLPPLTVLASYSCPRKSIEPYTGRILIDIIEDVVPSKGSNNNSSSSSSVHVNVDVDVNVNDAMLCHGNETKRNYGTNQTHNNNNQKNNLFDKIDECVDAVLQQLMETTTSSEDEKIQIVAVGFTTFCMNWIGVDTNYQPIGNDCTMSYACQTQSVQDEVQQLKRYVLCCIVNWIWIWIWIYML